MVTRASGVPGELIGELMVTAELHQTLNGETWLQSPEELPEPSVPFRSGSELPIPVLRGGKGLLMCARIKLLLLPTESVATSA